jgi:branched-chain amino acid transport system substrate-binding protein
MLRWSRLLAAFCCLLTLTTTVGSAADPLRIDAILSLTGPGAFLGNGEAEALRIIADTVNKRGGVNGHPVEFVIADDATSPANSVQLMTQAIARHAPVVIGPTIVSPCLATMPLQQQSLPVAYCLANGIHPPVGSYDFTAWVTVDSLIATALRYFQGRKLTRIAFITSADATGQETERAFDSDVERPAFKDITVTIREHFNPADLSVTAQMTRIKSSGAQAAIFWTVGTSFGTLLRGARDVGLDIPVLGGSGTMVHAQLAQYKDFVPHELLFAGTRAIAEGYVDRRPALRAALDAYSGAYQAAGKPVGLTGSLAWDVAMLVIDAYRHVGVDADAAKLRGWIASQRAWAGVHGMYDFTSVPQRGLGDNNVIIVRYDPVKPQFTFVAAP